jgi:hypothetical protein
MFADEEAMVGEHDFCRQVGRRGLNLSILLLLLPVFLSR